MCFHFGFLWLHLLSCRHFVAVFLSFDFRLLWLHFLSVLPSHLSFWPFGLSFPFVFACSPFIPFHLSLLTLHFLAFWPSRPSFPYILAFWAFISFHFCLLTLHFGLLGFHFPSFLPSHRSFPFILAFWVFFSFHFDPLGLHVSMQNHRVCTAFGETVLSKCAKNIGCSASFSEIDLQKLQKRVFAHFGQASFQKSVKTRCFLRFLKITLAKRR